ncbi:hypothetical protein HMPREF3038_02658 [Akkermansia sp. KLE1797]|nr:hypothetical protein HMPREF3038_02658 [Akkermansia sp. KLE1797]KXU53034.1 hypothetical protein HMPREF3039_02794 [Akkermansia sp. KLE1798]KZA03674.1 hypothetical protein HMPREF1326_02651 [Akkermansia sp. KLE1605]
MQKTVFPKKQVRPQSCHRPAAAKARNHPDADGRMARTHIFFHLPTVYGIAKQTGIR